VDAFVQAGGSSYLVRVANEHPAVFCALLGKILPMELAADEPITHEVVLKWMTPEMAKARGYVGPAEKMTTYESLILGLYAKGAKAPGQGIGPRDGLVVVDDGELLLLEDLLVDLDEAQAEDAGPLDEHLLDGVRVGADMGKEFVLNLGEQLALSGAAIDAFEPVQS
jgi:hypothetical protein